MNIRVEANKMGMAVSKLFLRSVESALLTLPRNRSESSTLEVINIYTDELIAGVVWSIAIHSKIATLDLEEAVVLGVRQKFKQYREWSLQQKEEVSQ